MSEQITSLNNNAPGTSYTNDNNGSQPLHQSTLTDMSFMSLKELHDSMKAPPSEDSMKYDPYVGHFLTGLRVDYVTSKFIEAKIDMKTFLTLTEDDLIAIGVPLSNTRTTILNGLKKLHRRKWDREAIPSADADEFTMEDGVKIVSNLTRHLQFLVATVIYTTKQVEKGPVLLPMQEDIPYSTVLLVSTKRAQVLTEMMELELKPLREKDNFAEADLITGWKPRHEKCSKFSLAYVTVTAVVGGALFGLWKMKKCLVP